SKAEFPDPAGDQRSSNQRGKAMSTCHSINLHITFATKDRTPWIKSEWLGRLHEYLGGIVKQLDAKPLMIGVVADHVHLLIGMKPTHQLSDFMRELKKSSS